MEERLNIKDCACFSFQISKLLPSLTSKEISLIHSSASVKIKSQVKPKFQSDIYYYKYYIKYNEAFYKKKPLLIVKLSIFLIDRSEANSMTKRHFQVGNDCMLDESISIGEKSSIKKSVIGKHTTIGERVKISNSVIMDHVTIKDG